MRRLIAALLASALLAGCGRAPVPAGVTELTYASPYPPGHPFSRADIRWMAWVEKASGGRIRIKPFWAGALLSSDQSMAEIRHGVADIGLITPIYTRGGAHAQRAQAGFYGGVRDMPEQIAVYQCIAARFPALTDELKGLRVLAIQPGNFPGIVTRSRPVRSLDDLKGLRLRAPAENLEVLRALGADPVDMPMADVYSALAKGVIDGVVAPADTLKSLHFAEVARYFTTLKVSRGSYPARAMGMARWNALPLADRQLLAESERAWEAALIDEINTAEQAGIQFGKTHGVTFLPISPADQARFDAMYNRNAARIARALTRFGADGTPIFTEAQRLIAADASGAPPPCASPAPDPSTHD
ncbi:C4-dicarboxylate ABC transporter permease [Sphingomonas metalli]|uniref:C4-dicarboxylate ABC transporter permease n=2 Tax=Sphingomonas metalli TaxID=1779358 RepID=A0A916T141_9SPHN|nr:C4-dicarboxylate ABC transporter permease [Sphingomonas metalli]